MLSWMHQYWSASARVHTSTPASQVQLRWHAGPMPRPSSGLPSQHANYHPADPEHLIVNGLGGAFLHPTHVFASARFGSVPEPCPEAVFVRGTSPRGRDSGRAFGRSLKGHSPPRGVSPPRRRLSRRAPAGGPLLCPRIVHPAQQHTARVHCLTVAPMQALMIMTIISA